MKIITMFFSLVIMINCMATESAKEIIERFDIGFYRPIDAGARDLVFEIDIANMTKMLNAAKYFGKLKKVYFEAYWAIGEDERIVVKGLPKGFLEKKKQLKAVAHNKFEFIMPKKLSERFKEYQLKKTLSSKGTLIRATNKSSSENYDEVYLLFGKNGKLISIKTIGPLGTNYAVFEMSSKSWSKNKWALDKMTVETLAGVQKSVVEYEFEYGTVGGIGFPIKISTEATYSISNSKAPAQKVTDQLVFRDFILNSGQAKTKIKSVVFN